MDFNECPVEILQNADEFSLLLGAFCELHPESVLEIGSLFGGTLWYWMQNVAPGSLIVSIDKRVPEGHKWYENQDLGHRKLWYEWADAAKVNLISFEGASSDPLILGPIKRFIGSFDFLFIDADHREEGVRYDYNTYGPMVRKGGIIAFHDISRGDGSANYGVCHLWEELKSKYRTEERELDTTKQGIGILYVE